MRDNDDIPRIVRFRDEEEENDYLFNVVALAWIGYILILIFFGMWIFV
jgi:hypothetical protein